MATFYSVVNNNGELLSLGNCEYMWYLPQVTTEANSHNAALKVALAKKAKNPGKLLTNYQRWVVGFGEVSIVEVTDDMTQDQLNEIDHPFIRVSRHATEQEIAKRLERDEWIKSLVRERPESTVESDLDQRMEVRNTSVTKIQYNLKGGKKVIRNLNPITGTFKDLTSYKAYSCHII